jgi:hypothetical protein
MSGYWGDQAFGNYSGRVPATGEYIGPYDTPEDLAEAISIATDEYAEMWAEPDPDDDCKHIDVPDDTCPWCGCGPSTTDTEDDR